MPWWMLILIWSASTLVLSWVFLVLSWVFIDLVLFGSRAIITLLSPQIKTQAELEKLLKKEQEVLGLSGKNIKASLEIFGVIGTRKLDNGSYFIEIRRGPKATRTAVAHELHHIRGGEVDKLKAIFNKKMAGPTAKTRIGKFWFFVKMKLAFVIFELIKYPYWYEPRAVFYEFSRLKACNLVLKQTS